MPHVDRDCSYFWSSRLCAAICISPMHTSLYIDAYSPLGQREKGREVRGKGTKGANRGGDPKRTFFEAPHRSAATDRPANRSTANKSRRFLRRAARVRSCPVFGNRSDEEERPFSSRLGGKGEGAVQQRAPARVIFGGGLVFAETMDDTSAFRGPSASRPAESFSSLNILSRRFCEKRGEMRASRQGSGKIFQGDLY